MKKIFLLVLVVLAGIIVFGQNTETPDVRNVSWNMSRDEVKSIEKSPLDSELTYYAGDKMLIYNATIMGYETRLAYMFDDKKLTSIVVIFKIDNQSANKYVEDYSKIERLLNDKYGSSYRNEYWRDDLYKNDPNDIGMALKMQHLEYSNKWESRRSVILLSMKAKDYEIGISLVYKSLVSEFKESSDQKNEY